MKTAHEAIASIRAEIERRKELLTPHKDQGVILCQEIIKQFDSLLSFINTISQPIMKNEIIGEIRAEIERRFSKYNHDSNHHIQAAECASILDFLDSLQQEQPAKRGHKDCNECKYNRLLKDQIGWQFRGCFGGDYKGKPIAEIELCPLKQEQPKVDLEKAYKSYMESRKDDLSGNTVTVNMKDLARHFYELGLNGKK